MGVQNLWVLLAPVGRQIEIESLAGKVLAVDASIWLTQFVKAMRDDEGNMIKNAHLIGTFHRVAKLLFYGIKPVFVFDGETPEIKKRTTARRRRRQEHQAANLKQTAQRILINRLKLQREELKRNGGKAAPAVAPNFVLPPSSSSSSSATASATETVPQASDRAATESAAPSTAQQPIEIDSSDDDAASRRQTSPPSAGASEAAPQQQQQLEASGADSANEDDDLTVDDIVLDTSRLSKIDLDAVFALPPHLQKDMINRILSDRRQEVRNKFIPLAGKPEAYSHTQLSAFLATTALHRRIDAAKKKHRDLVETPAASDASADAAKLGPGKRIASRSDRFFVYTRAEDRIGEHEDSASDSELAGDSVVHEIDATAASASLVPDESDDAVSGADFPLLTRLRQKKRTFRDEEEVGKQSLSDLSVASMKEFAMQAQRQQARQWGVQDASTAWYAKHASAPTKSEPILAIELARRKRLKIEEEQKSSAAASRDSNKSVETVEATSVCISFKTDDVSRADLARFHASLFAPKTEATAAKSPDDATSLSAATRDEDVEKHDEEAEDEDDDDDVDWEEVPSSTSADAVAPPSPETPARIERRQRDAVARADSSDATLTTGAPAATGAVQDVDDNESVEWEDVHTDESVEHPATASTLLNDGQSHAAPTTTTNSDDDEALEDAGAVDVIDDDSDELYLSLKNELEDAKAEDDLEELRSEALKSALATASNLTQWAAGAVRRALAAHSLQHKQFVENEQASAAGYASPLRGSNQSTPVRSSPFRGSHLSTPVRSSPLRRSGVSIADAIEIADGDDATEDEEAKTLATASSVDRQRTEMPASSSSASTSDAVPLVDVRATPSVRDDVAEDTDTHLQAAIADSMREDADAPRASRYLQYTAPVSSSSSPRPSPDATPVIDVAAIESEQHELKKLRNRQLRDTEGFSDDMVEDVMELLRLFGVPFLVCPMEAEAQCAALEQLGLVDGIITDDSDIFPFGGQRVYKNIFHNQKFVEAFYAQDIARELGFTQDELIALALLLGSDYTDGVRGIGIVNATEVVTAYPGGVPGLRAFKDWVQAFDLAEEAQRVADKKHKKSESDVAAMDVRERFQYTHASARRKWELGDEFPNVHVVKAYKQPQVDRSDARFSWSVPDLAALRGYTAQTFGWDQGKADSVLLPLVQKATAVAAGRGTQTRIDQFFRAYDDEVRYAKIQSKRLRSAVESRATKSSGAKPAAPAKAAKTLSSSTTTSKSKKKKTTLTALGFGQ